MNNEQRSIPTKQPPKMLITPPIQPEPKSKKRLILIILAVVLVLLIGFGGAYILLGNKSTDFQAKQDNQTQLAQQEKQTYYAERWIYTDEQEKQVYSYDSSNNKSTPFIKLSEDERVGVSPDGKTLVRTRKNVVETAISTEKPEFKQIYADTDHSTNVSVTWLPDNSGFIVNAGKITKSGQVPQSLHTITRIKADGSEPKMLFEYPVTYGGMSIEGVDLQRDELYLSESGEGGLRVPLGVYRLSDGAKLRHYEKNSDSVLSVTSGKAYMVKKIGDYKAEKAQIIEISLDNGQEKVVYETVATQGRSWLRNGSSFSDGIDVRTLKISKDGATLYFDEIHNFEKPVTKLKTLDLKSGNVKEFYTPTTVGTYITVETQTATPKGVFVRINCGGCATDENNKIGNEWVFIDPSSGKGQIIQKTNSDVYLSTFNDLLIAQ